MINHERKSKLIKYCIFDLDGTLLNTIDTIAYYVNNALQNHGREPITIAQAKRFVGDGASELIHRSLNALSPESLPMHEAILHEYKSRYDESPLYLTEAYDGIYELIEGLLSRGITLAVLSNKPHTALRSVMAHYFTNKFSAVLGARDGVPLKPNPLALISLMDSLGADPKEVMFIGDTGVDMKTGKNGGVGLTVGVSWGFREREELFRDGADRVVDHPKEILELCQ